MRKKGDDRIREGSAVTTMRVQMEKDASPLPFINCVLFGNWRHGVCTPRIRTGMDTHFLPRMFFFSVYLVANYALKNRRHGLSLKRVYL